MVKYTKQIARLEIINDVDLLKSICRDKFIMKIEIVVVSNI